MAVGSPTDRRSRPAVPSGNADLHDLRLALQDRFADLVSYALGGEPNRVLSNRREGRWGSNGSFSAALTGPRRGQWFDHEAQEGGGVFDLVLKRIVRGEFKDAVRWAREWLGWPAEGPAPAETRKDERRQERAAKIAAAEREEATERKRKIAWATKIWARTVPIEGTPGAAYLKATRAIPVETFPDVIRFDPVEHAVAFKATRGDGEFVGVQLVRVTPEGRKIAKDGDRLAKQSYGDFAGAAVRLPGRGDGPICIAEGPETGASIWAATGLETWIALGGAGKAEPIPGRKVIVARDDDKRDSPAQRAVGRAIKAWREAGIDCASTWPWPERRGDKSDFNDVLKIAGPDAVRARFDLVTQTPQRIAIRLPAKDEARRTMSARVGEFFAAAEGWNPEGETAAPVHALKVALGLGKTEAAISGALAMLERLRAAGDSRVIAYAVPEHRLSGEVMARALAMLKASGLRVAIWRGREAKYPGATDGRLMCGDFETVRKAISLKADIDAEVCGVCPLRETCAYLAQRGQEADLWIVAHAALFHAAPKAVADRGVAALIVDEGPWQAGLFGVSGRPIEIALDALDPGAMPVPKGDGPDGGARLSALRHSLKLALENESDGPISRAALARFGFDADSAATARRLEWRRKVESGPWRERLENSSLGPALALWGGIGDLMAADGPDLSGRLRLARSADKAHVIQLCGRQAVAATWQAPTLLIDATFDLELVRPYWPTVTLKGEIEVDAPHQTVRQVLGRSFAKNALQPIPDDLKEDRRRRRNRDKVRTFVETVAREAGGDVLLVSNKAIAEAMKAEGLSPRVHVAWFNAVAGRDEWRDVKAVIVVGRPLPRSEVTERIAGALTGAARMEADYQTEDIWRRQRAGAGVELIPGQAQRHPDDMAERVRASICEAQTLQAIGRGRGVNRTAETPLAVWVLSDVALPLPVDEFLSDDVVMKPSPEAMMLGAGGVAYAEPAAAALAYPRLWGTANAANMARKSSGSFSYEKFLQGKDPELLTVAYRRAGNGQRMGRALIDPARCPDPRAAIEAQLGPLAFFEVIQPETQARAADVVELRPGIAAPDAQPIPFVAAPVLPEAGDNPAPAPEAEGINAPLKGDDPPEPVVLDYAALRQRARDAGVPVGDLARQAGVSLPHLSNSAHGRRRLKPDVEARLIEIAAALPQIQGRLL